MKNLLCLIFIARVMFPMNVRVYDNVLIWSLFHENMYRLELADGREVFVPAFWTVIESKEQKEFK